MKGVAMMLKALGVEIDPREIERLFREGQEALPKIVKFLNDAWANIDERLTAIESQNRRIIALLETQNGGPGNSN